MEFIFLQKISSFSEFSFVVPEIQSFFGFSVLLGFEINEKPMFEYGNRKT